MSLLISSDLQDFLFLGLSVNQAVINCKIYFHSVFWSLISDLRLTQKAIEQHASKGKEKRDRFMVP